VAESDGAFRLQALPTATNDSAPMIAVNRRTSMAMSLPFLQLPFACLSSG
jgi:hypothetical protein